MKNQLRNRRAILIGVLILTGITILVLIFKPNAEDRLVKSAKEELLSTLKSPSTAVFVGEPELKKGFMRENAPCGSMYGFDVYRMEEKENNLESFYTVTMTVDAQNSYGATIREDFTCIFQPNYTWCTEAESFLEIREMCNEGLGDWYWDSYISE